MRFIETSALKGKNARIFKVSASSLTLLFLLSTMIFTSSCSGKRQPEKLQVFCGSALKPPMDELIKEFTTATGIQVNTAYGGSGEMLSQVKLSGRGDVYISGSPDFMEKAERFKMVDPETEKALAYMIPAIVVWKGNPKNIHTLEDLSRPDVYFAIADPETVCLGAYAVEILEKNGLLDKTLRNTRTRVESCSKAASVVALKKVDAVIGWQVFGQWNENLEVVAISPARLARVAYATVAILKSSKVPQAARKFIDYLASDAGRSVFEKHGYITSREEAARKVPGAKFGGEYRLPDISAYSNK